MRQRTAICMLLLVLFGLFHSPALFAEDSDIVNSVNVCGSDILIEMHNAGWVVVRESEVGYDSLNLMMSIALDFLNSEKATGYFNPGEPIELCGIEYVRPITILEPNGMD